MGIQLSLPEGRGKARGARSSRQPAESCVRGVALPALAASPSSMTRH